MRATPTSSANGSTAPPAIDEVPVSVSRSTHQQLVTSSGRSPHKDVRPKLVEE